NCTPTPMARSTHLAELFSRPSQTAQRHYEICRAYYFEQASAEQIAARFSLPVGSVRATVRDFAANPDPGQFFVDRRPGPTKAPQTLLSEGGGPLPAPPGPHPPGDPSAATAAGPDHQRAVPVSHPAKPRPGRPGHPARPRPGQAAGQGRL